MFVNYLWFLGLITGVFCERTEFLRRVKREPFKSIVEEPACGEVKVLCNNLSENDDILILECLQSLNPSRLADLRKECQNVIWTHVRALTSDARVKEFLGRYCSRDLENINNCAPGEYLKCIVNNKEKITDSSCNSVLMRLEGVAFQDYRWIANFLQHCNDDIKRLQCGKIDGTSWTQFETVTCLQNSILNVHDDCKREVFKLSELQAENIKLDRQLYIACAEDHQRYCQQFPAGSGRVFTCLMDQPKDRITNECHKQLLKRQKLISQDYRVSKGLMRACKDDIRKTHCRRQTSNDKNIRLAQILLCLENVAKNGSMKVDPDCEAELVEHRRILMEDFSLSPEIVDGCSEEIRNYCQGFEAGGKTIHCLMDHARFKNVKKRLGDTCMRALETLVKETDAGEDWRVDPVLHQACYPVVRAVCHDVKGGDARVMSCLMDNIGADHMTEECEDALIQIQYFIARDFKLDPKLYRACKEDAVRICHASTNWEETQKDQPTYEPQVLPCLYRHAYPSDNSIKIKTSCLQQIQRVMRQRAMSVDLQPEIEEVCLDDLALFCFDKTKRGEEMMCLQKNFDDLKDKCREAVESFTEVEAQHAELNPYIMQHCRKEMETLCSSELKNDEGDIMECLISHKNDPSVKANPACRVSIEHFQIISLKDYRFTYKFKIACKHFAIQFCGKARTKTEVVTCLSEKVTNATVNGLKSNVPKECRQQLKAQLLQQRENIDFDPKLKTACSSDIKLHCANVEHGNAQVLECLQTVREKLTERCEQEVFKVKRQEIYDNSVDYALTTMCGDAIEQFCSHHDRETVLECLKVNKDQKGFSKKCRSIVLHRMAEQNSNYQLNPALQENCKMDINKFCASIINSNHGKDLNGAVIKCLKSSFKKGVLSHKCESEMVYILREQALDVSLNPLIRVVCKNELDTICRVNEEDSGKTEECLKNALMERRIMTPECGVEVANMIEESQADIQVDPLLQQVCALDLLKFCKDVPQGNGRHIKCLRITMENNQLSAECKDMLTKRLKMYENVAQMAPPPGDFHELYHQVVASPAKHYFFLMFFMLLGTVLLIGISFGRSFRRRMTIKNK
ncbi:Golgi apparatus protein 1 [Tribolium castaneum]|uniref:Golgi apparatus protein 1-like Protein n=1 Tax=Tribolium castaneum TaxID=7070 RepID=D6WJR8_TRICA|nr:PREDICTED: Golgi apparatus protein 1 [Tribolium castaneum]EFA03106.1 Golgi apparatus protein 1-like Protein [Tribolium castaneum]|eukprot:XP_001813896.1 PREDICTED: Golgi apparatus protein 1 [Tribolium castaneum]